MIDDLKEIKNLVETVVEKVDKLDKRQTAMGEKLDHIEERLDGHTASLINIEETLKGYADMYMVNQEKNQEIEGRVEIIEDRLSILQK